MCFPSARRCAASWRAGRARHRGLPGSGADRIPGRAGFSPGFDSAVLNVSPAEVARQGYQGLMANKRQCCPALVSSWCLPAADCFRRAFILAAAADSSSGIAENGGKPALRHHWPVICLLFRSVTELT